MNRNHSAKLGESISSDGQAVAVLADGLVIDVPDRRLLEDGRISARPGECVAIMGPSGSGKTTLLSCLAGIRSPNHGVIEIAGHSLRGMSAAARARFRLRNIGMVFQFGELLPELSVSANVELPLRLLGASPRASTEQAADWLEKVGLDGRGDELPGALSGGELQRVAVARALCHRPAVILADEPTGSLDEEGAMEIIGLLVGLCHDSGTTAVIATHDQRVAAASDLVLQLYRRRLTEAGI